MFSKFLQNPYHYRDRPKIISYPAKPFFTIDRYIHKPKRYTTHTQTPYCQYLTKVFSKFLQNPYHYRDRPKIISYPAKPFFTIDRYIHKPKRYITHTQTPYCQYLTKVFSKFLQNPYHYRDRPKIISYPAKPFFTIDRYIHKPKRYTTHTQTQSCQYLAITISCSPHKPHNNVQVAALSTESRCYQYPSCRGAPPGHRGAPPAPPQTCS